MPFPFIETIIRLIVPFSIFKWPLTGIIISNLSDMYDWKFIKVKTAEDLRLYQTWDKAMDLYYQTIIVLVILRFKDEIFKKTAIILFFVRVAGDALFFLTSNRNFLLIFPNMFENFVIFYLVYRRYVGKEILFKSKKILLIVLLIIGIPKLIHEYFLHYLLIQPWQWFDAGLKLGLSGFFQEYANYFIWGGLLYVIPMAAALIILKKKAKPRKQRQKV